MIKVGISQCLMGEKVRYDGGHKQDRFCKDELSKIFQFVALCPEVGIGLPIPRKTIRLIGDIGSPNAVMSHDYSVDVTEQLADFANQNTHHLQKMSGYVFCKASPSCGVERVKVYQSNGFAESKGAGIFAARVQKLFPLLPVEEDGRLNDPLLRDSFIKRVFLYNEWQEMLESGLTVNKLFEFHARHKMTLLAHCQKTYRAIGPMISPVKPATLKAVSDSYIKMLLQGMKSPATRANNTNVLMHLQGYLKKLLSADDKAELAQSVLEYAKGIQPILAPITLFKHHFRNNPMPYIQRLSYMNPYPKELAIRVKTY